jgi:hypothetical protein
MLERIVVVRGNARREGCVLAFGSLVMSAFPRWKGWMQTWVAFVPGTNKENSTLHAKIA